MKLAINLLKAPRVGVRELKEKLSAFLKQDEPLIVTDRGEPTNIILAYDDFVEMIDIIDELNDPETLELVKSGRNSIRAGAAGIPVFSKAAKRK